METEAHSVPKKQGTALEQRQSLFKSSYHKKSGRF